MNSKHFKQINTVAPKIPDEHEKQLKQNLVEKVTYLRTGLHSLPSRLVWFYQAGMTGN